MINVVAFIGKAGAGKDFLKQKVLTEYSNQYPLAEIISCTTRPKRDNEIDGKNYHFLSDDEFCTKINSGEMLEFTTFNNWFYGTSLDALDEHKINIGVFNPEGVRNLARYDNINAKIILVMASNKTRLLRQLYREEMPDVDEIVRRYIADDFDFQGLDFEYTEVVNDEYYGNHYHAIVQIEEILKELKDKID